MSVLSQEAVDAWRKLNPMVFCDRHGTLLSEKSCRKYAKANPARCEGCERAGRQIRKKRCSVDGCRRELYAKGKCRLHWQHDYLARKREQVR